MSEQIGDGLDMHTGFEPAKGRRVPQGVRPDTFDPGCLGGDFDDPQETARVDRAAELGGEHQPRVGPLVARAEPFRLLFGAVLAQHRHDRGRYGYCASRTVGLRLTDDQLVVDPRNGGRDLDGSGVEVDAIPPQRQRLTLAQPGRCDEHQHRVVAGRLSGPQHRGHVGIVQVSGLAPFDARTLHQGSRAP